jgi:hut operon positive regulator
MNNIGKTAILIALSNEDNRLQLASEAKSVGYQICIGKVGTMDPGKIISAMMTAAKRENIWDGVSFRQEHALYDAMREAISGFCRGQISLSEISLTVGLTFTIVRGQMPTHTSEGEWVAVCLYGTIGAPIKGFEHEAIGLGINHI